MSLRAIFNAGRIIMSKAGFDASTVLPDENKLFDSDWFATGMIAAQGTFNKPSNAEFSHPHGLALHYVPAAEVIPPSKKPMCATVTSTHIIVPGFTESGTYRYTIWAISQ